MKRYVFSEHLDFNIVFVYSSNRERHQNHFPLAPTNLKAVVSIYLSWFNLVSQALLPLGKITEIQRKNKNNNIKKSMKNHQK